jgi:hypothetical protein
MKELSEGKGRTQIRLGIEGFGSDIYLELIGGSTHLGCAVLCEPGQKAKSITLGNHKEHVVAVPLAEAAAKKYNKTVAVLAGIHIDNATPEEIEEIKRNCRLLEKEL